jgi:hypothetical protein
MILTYDEFIVRWNRRMRPNPGGRIASSDVVGRDRLIAAIWRVLEQQSVQLLSERRIGKTSVVCKMIAEPQEGLGRSARRTSTCGWSTRVRSDYTPCWIICTGTDMPIGP